MQGVDTSHVCIGGQKGKIFQQKKSTTTAITVKWNIN